MSSTDQRTSHAGSSSEDPQGLSEFPIRSWALSRFLGVYAVLVAVGLVLGGLLVHTPVGDPVENVDTEVATWFASERSAELTQWSARGSEFGGTVPVISAVIVLSVAFFFVFRRWRESASLATALGLEALVFVTVSTIIGRNRPPVEQLDASPPTASFPSGHTGAATALYTTLAVIVWWNTENRVVRLIAGALAVLLPVSVAVSRMYRGMHFLTDVVVGVILGAAAAWAAVRLTSEAVERRRSS